MTNSIANLTNVRSCVQDLLARQRRDRIDWVRAEVGSGRSELARELVARLPGAVLLDPPGMTEDDSGLQALMQAAAAVDSSSLKIACDEEKTWEERCKLVAAKLAKSDKTVVIRVPNSWTTKRDRRAGTQLRQRNCLDLLRTFVSEATLPVVLISTNTFKPDWLRAARAITLRRASANLDSLEQPELWGTYGAYAEQLAKAMFALKSRAVSPLQLRLAVGLVALGEAPFQAARWLQQWQSQPRKMASQVINRVFTVDTCRELRGPLLAATKPRRAIERDVLVEVSKIPPQHETLLTHCVGYGESHIKLIDVFREQAVKQTDLFSGDQLHVDLAEHYETLDGAISPWSLRPEEVTPWLEKLHHLALAGEKGRSKWDQHEKPCREFYWTLGRELSRRRKYQDAADVFEQATRLAPQDHYSWHYRAFNLDRARGHAADIERGYREAVRLDPDNPWWNSRLVSFLIDRGKFGEARVVWEQALRNIDPDGTVVADDTWLANNCHVRVARAWLEADQITDAEDVLELVPDDIRVCDERLSSVYDELLDAREAELLGESVYPSAYPMKDRWHQPNVLHERVEGGKELNAWYPARVVDMSEERVQLVLATVEPTMEERRVLEVTYPANVWDEALRGSLEKENPFVFIGVYGTDEPTTVIVSNSGHRRRARLDELDASRFAERVLAQD